MTHSEGISVFSCHILNTRHVCLMNDHTTEGKVYNATVFALMKTWIHHVLATPDTPYTPGTIMAFRFAESATRLLRERGYLRNIDAITLKRTDGEITYTPEKTDIAGKIVMTATDDDKFYSKLDDFKPSVR